MPKSLSLFAVLAAAVFSTAAFAQEATEETQAEGATASPLSMGTEAAQDATYIKEEHGDWMLRCFRNENGDDPCQMYQLLKEAEGNPIAEFSIFRIDEESPAAAGGTIVVPLLTLLAAELKLSVDGGVVKAYPYRFCSPNGCVAQIGFTEEEIAAFQRGAEARLTLIPAMAPNQTVDIFVSLKGFTAAFEQASSFSN